MSPHPLSRSRAGGFSLVEMLVVISLIGIISAIAVLVIPNVNSGAHQAKAMRNAQQLASIFQTAQAAGLDFYDPDLATIVGDLVEGDTLSAPGSVFDGAFFSVPGMSPDEQLQALPFLAVDTDQRTITYDYTNTGP